MKVDRDLYKIPDSYQKDTHVGNWLRKNMMPTLKGVYIQDKHNRGTLTKSNVDMIHSEIICCFEKGHTVKMSFSEHVFLEKN